MTGVPKFTGDVYVIVKLGLTTAPPPMGGVTNCTLFTPSLRPVSFRKHIDDHRIGSEGVGGIIHGHGYVHGHDGNRHRGLRPPSTVANLVHKTVGTRRSPVSARS